jgi:hypothetical protein
MGDLQVGEAYRSELSKKFAGIGPLGATFVVVSVMVL